MTKDILWRFRTAVYEQFVTCSQVVCILFEETIVRRDVFLPNVRNSLLQKCRLHDQHARYLEVYSYPNKAKFREDVVDIACLRYVSIVYAYTTSSVGQSHSSDFLFVRVSCEKVFVRRQATIR